MPKARTIGIFLAFSSELAGDRKEFESLINEKNKLLNQENIFNELDKQANVSQGAIKITKSLSFLKTKRILSVLPILPDVETLIGLTISLEAGLETGIPLNF
jgi:hypothetical protein